MIPIITSVRGLLLASLVIGGLAAFVISNNSKDKNEYEKATGIIEFLEKEYKHLPTRNKGNYRYLIIDSYPYPFEIFEPNSLETDQTIDDLKEGDIIDVYYYETEYTLEEGLNRYVQFIDNDGKSHFIRDGFQKQLGFVLLGSAFLLNLMGFVFWKMGKLEW